VVITFPLAAGLPEVRHPAPPAQAPRRVTSSWLGVTINAASGDRNALGVVSSRTRRRAAQALVDRAERVAGSVDEDAITVMGWTAPQEARVASRGWHNLGLTVTVLGVYMAMMHVSP